MMGVRRVQIDALIIAKWLQDGFRVSQALEPVADANLLDVRLAGNPYRVEMLIESPTFDGPGPEGRWVDISEGRWDGFAIFNPTFRDPYPRESTSTAASGLFAPLPADRLFDDSDERHGEVPGA